MSPAIRHTYLRISSTAALAACLSVAAPAGAQAAGSSAPVSPETSDAAKATDASIDSIPAPPSDPIGEALAERLDLVIPRETELFSDENGWQRYVASTNVSDLQLTWRGMPDEDRDTLARAVRAGRTLLCIQAEDEKLLALSLMDFESAELAARFVSAAQAMNAAQFVTAPGSGSIPGSGSASADSSEVDAATEPANPGPAFNDLQQRRFDLGTLKNAAETTVLMTVPGSPLAPTRILRAQIGTSACELLTVRLDNDADSQQVEAWFKQAIQSLDLPLPLPPEDPPEQDTPTE